MLHIYVRLFFYWMDPEEEVKCYLFAAFGSALHVAPLKTKYLRAQQFSLSNGAMQVLKKNN